MKKTLLTLTTLTIGALSASEITDDLAFSGAIDNTPIIEKTEKEKNIGHITFKVGPSTGEEGFSNLIPVFGIGYQSKLNDSLIFQSSSIEFGGSYKQKKSKKDNTYQDEGEGLIYYPKIMGIHYWNKKSDNRLFTSAGTNISTHYKWFYSPAYMASTTSLGVSIAAGIEMGKASAGINILKIEYDQPTISVYSTGKENLSGRITTSYVVGF